MSSRPGSSANTSSTRRSARNRAAAERMARPPRDTTSEPLVRWEEAPPQVNVLDWRKRASSYGLRAPVAEEDGSEPAEFDRAPEQLIGEEDPEAVEAQLVDGDTEPLDADALNDE